MGNYVAILNVHVTVDAENEDDAQSQVEDIMENLTAEGHRVNLDTIDEEEEAEDFGDFGDKEVTDKEDISSSESDKKSKKKRRK